MDISLIKKSAISQLEQLEKPCFSIIVNLNEFKSHVFKMITNVVVSLIIYPIFFIVQNQFFFYGFHVFAPFNKKHCLEHHAHTTW
jgi:hypothetical protein